MQEESRVERKKREARQRIVEAAEDLFFSGQGYEKTTIRDIAEKADVSTGAVYTHFSGKAAILTCLVDRFFEDIGGIFRRRMEAADRGIDKVEAFIDFSGEIATQKRYLAYLHTMIRFEPEDLDGEVLESLRKNARAFQEILNSIIERGKADGTITLPGQPKVIAFTLMHLTQSFLRDLTGRNLVKTVSAFPDLPVEDIFAMLKTTILSALQSKPAKDTAVKKP